MSKYVLAYVPFCLLRFLSLGHNILPPWHPTELKRFHTSLIFVTSLIFAIKKKYVALFSFPLWGKRKSKAYTHICAQMHAHTHVGLALLDLGLVLLALLVHNIKRNAFNGVTELIGSNRINNSVN